MSKHTSIRNLIYFLFLTLIASCDDGDIIITSFEFDDVDLQLCTGSKENEFVFFKINESINEAISYNFISDTYSETTVTPTPITINLDNTTNSLIYRQFSATITADYYCSNIPPADILVNEELVGASGIAEIFNEIIQEDDNDGVPAEDEDINGNGNLEDDDTDGDGIPNYKDQDDDNDNILTSVELPNNIPDNDDPRDSDGDQIPDYLDDDDDNDDKLTRNEDSDANGNPLDDFLDENNRITPLYLDPDADNAEVIVAPSKNNTVQTTFRTTVTVNQLMFDGDNANFEDNSFSFGFRDITVSITTEL
ncbi:hypothetical protein M0D21_21160 [Aquimarina sp. D1M17]|uniref:hypothetical protein n=1 Tax=Aquimarina acroporae TaxID=2937283 RepID=UPI0020C044D4|nr:hypothetical protein [Aquimarina acroporae]MCK8524101.1 hypothetical protein [Aquimarina acroporae]